MTGLFESLGFVINTEKSVFTASQSIEYLGVVIGPRRMSFSLPEEKVSKIRSLCRHAIVIDTKECSLRQ